MNITKLGVILTVPLTKKIHRMHLIKINTEGNTSKEILNTRRTPTKYATAWNQTQPRRRRYGWISRECDIYANTLQLHTCTCHYAGSPERDNPTALLNDQKGRVYNAQKVMNKGNSAKSLRHGAPPRTAHREEKTITLGGPHHVVEETAGVTEISGKYH